MESESNTKLLKQYTKRERKATTSKRLDAVKAGAKGAKRGEIEEDKSTKKTKAWPGAKYYKLATSSSAISMMVFAGACLAIVQYGDKMADYVE